MPATTVGNDERSVGGRAQSVTSQIPADVLLNKTADSGKAKEIQVLIQM